MNERIFFLSKQVPTHVVLLKVYAVQYIRWLKGFELL